ncbi:MAG: hypothetical protein ACRDHN_06280 [Thermomicrobiales bacterium]
MFHESSNSQFGLTLTELDDFISKRMDQLDSLQEDQENLGPFGDLLRSATQIAFHRAAELIEANNQRLTEQFAALFNRDEQKER